MTARQRALTSAGQALRSPKPPGGGRFEVVMVVALAAVSLALLVIR